MDNETRRVNLPAHFVEIHSQQLLSGDRVEWGVTVVLQADKDGAYIASGVGTSRDLAEAQKTARAQFLTGLKEKWGL